MEATSQSYNQAEDEEEYVLLDLDCVLGQFDIPPSAPYVLSGLDSSNPILTIDNRFKLIGEYEETIGTCIVFTEGEAAPMDHEETGVSQANLCPDKFKTDPKQAPAKSIKPVSQLHKVLKFRLLSEISDVDGTATKTNA